MVFVLLGKENNKSIVLFKSEKVSWDFL